MKENIGIFYAMWLFLWNMIKNSVVYKIVSGLYAKISNAWQNSRIANLFRKTYVDKNALTNSIAGRIIRSPFTFLEFLQRKIGARLTATIEKSFFLNLCRDYINNLFAINLRFIGVFGLSMMVSMTAVGLMFGLNVTAGIVLAVVFALISAADVNVTDYIKNSALAKLICTLFDIEADFNWYDKDYTKGKRRFIPAVALGILSGAVAGCCISRNLPLAIVLAIGPAAVFLVMQKPSFGVYHLVFATPLVPTMAAVGLAVLCILSLIVYALTHKDFKWKFDGMGFFVIVFILIYFMAAVTSFAPMKSFSIWAIYFVFMTVYFVIINSINSEKLLNNLLVMFVISGFLVCLYGVAQYVFGWDTSQAWMDEEMFTDIKMRIYSTLGNPNVLGEFILLALPTSIGLMWTRRNAAAKIVYAGISAVMFAALILTFSRGCWIGLLVAAAIFITFAAGKLWGLGLIALPVIPMVLPESIINRFMSIGDMKDSSTSYRVYIWMGTLAMMKDFWISGIGIGQEAFTQVYPFYSYNAIVAPHSHNLFLQILVESGVAGITVFLLIVFFFLRKIMLGYRVGGKGNKLSTIMTAIAAGVCGFLVQGMFDNCFYNYRVMLVFWCVLAMGRACAYVAEKGSGVTDD